MLLLLLEPVVLLPCSFCFSSSSCSSCPPWCLVVLVVNVVPPRFSLPWLSSCSSYIFCLSSCWKSSAGRTHTRRRARSRAKLCPHLFDVPICLSCLRRRSTTWSLTAQSSRARTVRWREFRAKLFFRAPQAAVVSAIVVLSPLGQKGFRGSKHATATTRAPPRPPPLPIRFRETGRKGPSQRLVRDHRCWLQPQQAAGDAWCGILGMRRFSPIGWF